MQTYRAAIVGCSRMGAFIDNEVTDYQAIKLPYSHAAGFHDSERVNLVACSDLRTSVMEEFGQCYDVPIDHQYVNYRDMIEKEKLDIISVATQPEQRAEIITYAAENGVKAIYAEKAMAASMSEVNAIVESVERNNVIFNLGTNRRWHTGFDKMKEIIDSDELGKLRTLIIYSNGTLFNTASHNFDLILRLNNDHSAKWVSSHLRNSDQTIEGNIIYEDPIGEGMIQFENGVMAHALHSPRHSEWEAICEKGNLTCWNNGWKWKIRYQKQIPGWRTGLVEDTFPDFERSSSTANLIKDIVKSLDTGEPTRGGVRCAYASTELIFAFIESHLGNGIRISVPLEESQLQLHRSHKPRQPKVT